MGESQDYHVPDFLTFADYSCPVCAAGVDLPRRLCFRCACGIADGSGWPRRIADRDYLIWHQLGDGGFHRVSV